MTAEPNPDVCAALTEKDLQKAVRKFAEDFGWKIAVTWTSLHSPRGWPDLFMVRNGEVVAVELKREKGKTTEYQDAWLEELGKVPGVKFAGVVRPSDWFGGVLDEVLR